MILYSSLEMISYFDQHLEWIRISIICIFNFYLCVVTPAEISNTENHKNYYILTEVMCPMGSFKYNYGMWSLGLNLNSLLVKRQIDNPSPGAVTGGFA